MEKKSILVIDDDRDVLELVRTLLETKGYDVDEAQAGDEILERLMHGGDYDLIITDVWMPWMSGLQVAHFAQMAGRSTPVLFMSGFDDPSLEQRVRIFGGDDRVGLLRKPFDAAALYDAVGDLLVPPDARVALEGGTKRRPGDHVGCAKTQ